jgi:O-antigen ligase
MVLLALWIFELHTRKQKLFLPKSNWVAVAFVVWSGLSLTKADDMSSAFFDLLRLIKLYVLYLYVANNVRSKETIGTLMKFLLLGVILQGLLCVYQYLAQDIGYVFARVLGQQELYTERVLQVVDPFFSISGQGELRRASGTVGPINSQAQFFEFLLPISLLLWLTVKKCRTYLFYFASFLLGLSGLIVTFSRGGFVGITIGILVSILLAGRFGIISNKKLLVFLLFGLGLTVLISPIVYKYMMTRPEAATVRFHLAKVGLEMIGDHPILGVGLNNHVIIKPQYDTRDYVLSMPSHNQYIIIASEVGIPGLLFFLGFLVVTCKLALSVARCEEPYLSPLAVGIFGGLVAVVTHIMFDVLGTHTVMTLLWLYAGLAAALYKWHSTPSVEDV